MRAATGYLRFSEGTIGQEAQSLKLELLTQRVSSLRSVESRFRSPATSFHHLSIFLATGQVRLPQVGSEKPLKALAMSGVCYCRECLLNGAFGFFLSLLATLEEQSDEKNFHKSLGLGLEVVEV